MVRVYSFELFDPNCKEQFQVESPPPPRPLFRLSLRSMRSGDVHVSVTPVPRTREPRPCDLDHVSNCFTRVARCSPVKYLTLVSEHETRILVAFTGSHPLPFGAVFPSLVRPGAASLKERNLHIVNRPCGYFRKDSGTVAHSPGLGSSPVLDRKSLSQPFAFPGVRAFLPR